MMVCPRCSSLYVVRDGKTYNKKKTSQKYRCNSCKKYFSIPIDTDVKEYKEVKPGQVFRYESDTTHYQYFTEIANITYAPSLSAHIQLQNNQNNKSKAKRFF